MMKNLLFLHSSSELYGSDKSLYNLIRGLDKTQYKIYVLLPQHGPLVDLIESITGVEVTINDFAVLRRKDFNIIGILKYGVHFLKSVFFIKNLIKDKSIDIVYTNTAVVFVGAFAAKVSGRKSVWHIREIISNKNERRIISFIVNKLSDIIIANSKSTGMAITNDNSQIRVVYNTIESPTETDNKLKVKKNDEVVVGMAGRINRWKGQKLFVDIAKNVLQSNIKVKFVIAGNAYKDEEFLEDELRKYIMGNNLEGHVKLLGLVEDMNAFYEKIDIFILPSIKPEPFGLVVLEAMSKSIPVVATNHGGPTEIIKDGINGYLVDYENISSFVNVIAKLVEDENLREKIGTKGKINQEENFSFKSYTKQIDSILKEL